MVHGSQLAVKGVGRPVIGLGLVFVIALALNLIAGVLYYRVDLTGEGLYTLSDGSRRILQKLDDPVQLKLFYSASTKNISPRLKNYATRARELLEEYELYSGGSIDLDVYDVKPDTEEEEWAAKYGLQAVPLPTGESFFFGMVASQLDREVALPFFDPDREEFLEYDVTEAIQTLSRSTRPKVGVLSSLPVLGGPQLPPGMGRQTSAPWAMVDQFRKTYTVSSISMTATEIPSDLDLLLVIHPKKPSDALLYAIDQYVLGGGKLVVFIDPSCRSDDLEPGGLQQGRIPDKSSSLTRLLDAWGVEMEPKVVSDLNGAIRVNTGRGAADYPLWIRIGPDGLARTEAVTAQLENLLFIESGHFRLTEDSPLSLAPLVSTSENSTTVETIRALLADPASLAREHKGEGKRLHVAVRLNGKLSTAFPEGKPAAGDSDTDDASAADPQVGLQESAGDVTLMLVGDVDLLTDEFSVQVVNFFGRRMLQPVNDNLNFLLNLVELMIGSQDLISVRSRGKFARPFDAVAELRREAQEKWQQEEQALTAKVQQLQSKLNELQRSKEGQNKLLLGSEQLRELEKFRSEQVEAKKKLRQVRRNLRQDIEALGRWLAVLNIFAVPFVVALAGIFIALYKRKKLRSEST